MSEIKKNITSIFMVPTLFIGRDNLIDNGFVNGYVCDLQKEFNYEDCVYVLFRPKDIMRFREFLQVEYDRTESIVEDYDYEGGYVVVVYKLKTKFKKDFDLIKQGKYSKTSQEFKDLFPKTITIMKGLLRRDEISLQYRVFYKTEDLKKYWEDKLGVDFTDDMELWQGFNEEHESLNLKTLKIEYV